nr:RDD family protein [Thalassotalea piscium]
MLTSFAFEVDKSLFGLPLAPPRKRANALQPDVSNQVAPQDKETHQTFYEGLDWFKGVIKDLGLSFGWAALYFSVLTSVWNGQTLGKRIMQLSVIQLDGSPLTVRESFGRYGGYGAGLATGLLGFLQIYWDANRQCIHDKISSTAVIDNKKTINKNKH